MGDSNRTSSNCAALALLRSSFHKFSLPTSSKPVSKLNMRFALFTTFLIAGASAMPAELTAKELDDAGLTTEMEGWTFPASYSFESIQDLEPSQHPDIFERATDLDPDATAQLINSTLTARTEDNLLESRATVRTNVNVGEDRIDYGCKASIRKTLGEAIRALCNNGACNTSRVYARRVDWTNGGAIHKRNIEVRASGFYDGKNTRHYLQEAALATANGKTAKPENRYWSIGNHMWGYCNMSKFSNFIQIDRRVNGMMKDHLQMTMKMSNTNGMWQVVRS